MTNYNRVIMAGTLCADPELKFLPSNTPVAEIRLACNRRYRGSDGEQKEDTCFINAKAFARKAEVINQYFRKGKPILIEGRLAYQQWQSQDGQKRSKHEIIIENFQFLADGGSDTRQQSGSYARGNGQPSARPQSQQTPQDYKEPPVEMDGDSIPF